MSPKYRAENAFLEAKDLPGSCLSGAHEVTSVRRPTLNIQLLLLYPACYPQLVLEHAQKALPPQLTQTAGDDFFKLVT